MIRLKKKESFIPTLEGIYRSSDRICSFYNCGDLGSRNLKQFIQDHRTIKSNKNENSRVSDFQVSTILY